VLLVCEFSPSSLICEKRRMCAEEFEVDKVDSADLVGVTSEGMVRL
jgi:hypothetical protein